MENCCIADAMYLKNDYVTNHGAIAERERQTA